MKKIITILLASFAAFAMTTSCVDDVKPVLEGQPASLTVQITAPAPSTVSTKATDLQETNISDLSLFFYRKDNYLDRPKTVISLVGESQLGTPSKVTATNYIYTITLEDSELTSGEYYLYAVANSNSSNFGTVDVNSLKDLSLDDLKAAVVAKNNTSIALMENSLLMTGVYGRGDGTVTLQPGANDLSSGERIHLRRMTAKVEFTIESATGVTFRPLSYSVYNCPQKATLFERSGWKSNTGSVDNVGGTFPESLPDAGFTQVYFNSLDKDIAGQDGFSFYVMENALTAKSTPASFAARSIHTSAADQSFLNAPDNGTYVVITGQYEGPVTVDGAGSKASGKVSYTIHLGNCSSSGSLGNYTVRRNGKYLYNIKVAGVDKIITEAMYTGNEYVTYDSAAEGNLYSIAAGTTNIEVDSHYETVMVKMPNFSANEYVVRSITPYENISYSSNEAAGATKPADVSWIEFVKPSSATALPTYPSTAASKGDIYDLLADVVAYQTNGTTPKYFLVSGGNFYTAAFVNEFYYEDKELKSFVNVDDRELTLASGLSISKDGKSSYAVTPIFSIRQKSIRSMYNLDVTESGYNPFGIEFKEEFGPMTWAGISGTSYNSDSQSSSSDTDGWTNSKQYVTVGDKWSNYIDMSKLGHFDNSESNAEDALMSSYQYARFQCLARNRDENGDGYIDQSELKWYLPAIEQCLTIWYGYPSLGGDAKLHSEYQGYFSSSYGSSGLKRVWYIDEGASFGKYSGAEGWLFGYQGTKSSPTGLLGVRCARSLGSGMYNQPVSSSTSYDSSNRVISLDKLGSTSVREAGSVTVEYLPHQRNEDSDQLPSAFQVASANLSATIDSSTVTTFSYEQITEQDLCHDYYQEDDEAIGEGGWRIPNEREFGLMVRFMSSSLTNKTGARTYYYRSDVSMNCSYMYSGGVVTTDSSEKMYPSGSGSATIRCVRDYIQ